MKTVSATKKHQEHTISRWWHAAVAIAAVVISVRFATYANDPLLYAIPNFLLFTPFREATLSAWVKVLKYDRSQEKETMPIPEIQAKDFSFEALRLATQNFRSPAVVRGVFSNTTAVRRWSEPGYLASKIGHHEVVAVQKAYADKLEDDREVIPETFRQAYAEILENQDSTKYLFFPEVSHHQKDEKCKNMFCREDSVQTLQDDVNKMVREDLSLEERLWHGFGTASHRTYVASQIIAGRGRPSSDRRPTGSNWHCAVGNNWFAQVTGRKRWYFLDQKYSAYMQPLRGGINHFATGSSQMKELQKYLPVQYVDLQPGDMLYNPDFEWHMVRNYPGLSIGVPIRELNLTLSVQNNMQYLAIVGINNALALFNGFTYGLTKDQ